MSWPENPGFAGGELSSSANLQQFCFDEETCDYVSQAFAETCARPVVEYRIDIPGIRIRQDEESSTH